MIHIFEGADLVGKTSLANKASSELGIPIIKKRFDVFKNLKDLLERDDIETITEMFFESIFPLGVTYDFIIDRSLLSSLVYSKYFNRKVDLDYVYKYLFTPELNEHLNITLVIANEESMKTRFIDRGEKLFILKEILIIQDIYIKTSEYLNKTANKEIIKTIWNNNADFPAVH